MHWEVELSKHTLEGSYDLDKQSKIIKLGQSQQVTDTLTDHSTTQKQFVSNAAPTSHI